MHVFLIAAISVDGFIDPGTNTSSLTWTSKADKQFFRERTKQAGVMIVGRTTFETIGVALPGRKIYVLSSQPKPATYAALSDDAVEFTSDTPEVLLKRLAAQGVSEVAVCGGSQVYTHFLKAGLVETVYLTVEPILFGTGVSLCATPLQTKLQLQERRALSEQTTLLVFAVQR